MTDIKAHAARLSRKALQDLSAARTIRATISAPWWTADLSRHQLDEDAENGLLSLAETAGLPEAVSAMFSGERINTSEDRAVLHWALRATGQLAEEPNDVRASLKDGDEFADAVSGGSIVAASGQPFRNIVHIGIGGSDFGPRLIADAFEHERDRQLTLRFCANLDPMDLTLALDGLDPAETLVIGVSKSFGTEETLYNLTRARDWLQATLGASTPHHLALVTSRKDRAREWLGGADVRTFDLPAVVGGRFSLWSNAALACRIVLGPEIITGIRTGAADMDRHFKDTPIADNLPIRLALLDYWNRNGLARSMRVLLAYARRLRLLPTYLQQLEMESNGKSVSPSGEAASGPTAPALWGGEGSVGQHSYHQWLHQGCDVAPTEFVLAPEPSIDLAGTQALIAHALAQAEVLANGRTADEIRKDEPDLDEAIVQQKVHPGGRPSTMLVAKAFSPEAFGALIALYEHRTFAAGVLWGINSFDQWGVERGKTMAARIKQMLAGSSESNDPVTQSLIGLLNSTD